MKNIEGKKLLNLLEIELANSDEEISMHQLMIDKERVARSSILKKIEALEAKGFSSVIKKVE